MAIIKIKNRKDYYVQIDKKTVEDKNLSFKATGLLVYLMGRPDDWKVMLSHLKTCKTDGIDSVRTALLELRKNDYCHLFEMRVKGVVRERFYYVFETPTPYCEDLLIRVMEDFYDAPDETAIVHVPVNNRMAYKKDEVRETYPQADIPKMETPELKTPRVEISKLESVNSEIDIYNSEILDEPVSETDIPELESLENEKLEIDSFDSQFFEDVETESEISISELFKPETLQLENLYGINPETVIPETEKPQVVKPKTDYPQVDYPQVEKPKTDKPKLENPTLLIKDYTNNRFTNKRTTKERVTNKRTTTKETTKENNLVKNKENSSSSFSFFHRDSSLALYDLTLRTPMKDTQVFSKKRFDAVLYNPLKNKKEASSSIDYSSAIAP